MPGRRSQMKVPEGKLVRIEAVCDQGVISNIRITGDFFVHPEEALFTIERELDGLRLTGKEEDLGQKVITTVSASGATLIGFGPDNIADLLRELRC
jgi:lipoate---protein ligase